MVTTAMLARVPQVEVVRVAVGATATTPVPVTAARVWQATLLVSQNATQVVAARTRLCPQQVLVRVVLGSTTHLYQIKAVAVMVVRTVCLTQAVAVVVAPQVAQVWSSCRY
jgi:hypothetical protein